MRWWELAVYSLGTEHVLMGLECVKPWIPSPRLQTLKEKRCRLVKTNFCLLSIALREHPIVVWVLLGMRVTVLGRPTGRGRGGLLCGYLPVSQVKGSVESTTYVQKHPFLPSCYTLPFSACPPRVPRLASTLLVAPEFQDLHFSAQVSFWEKGRQSHPWCPVLSHRTTGISFGHL